MLTVLVANVYTPAQVDDLWTTFPSVKFVQLDQEGNVPPEGRDATVILRCSMWKGPLMRALEQAPGLTWIHTCTAGFEWLLGPELAEKGLTVTRSGNSLNIAMGEFVLGFIFLVSKKFPTFLRSQAAHRWEPIDSEEVAGKTVGIVGAGAVGVEIARRCAAMEMRVLGTKRTPEPRPYFEQVLSPDRLDVLLEESDFLVLACPLTPETRGMIGRAQIELMKPSAYLINVARGALTDEPALAQALREGVIAGACIDAYGEEPLPADSPFWDLENVVATPHCSYRSPLTMVRAFEEFKVNLARYLKGEPLLNPLRDVTLGY